MTAAYKSQLSALTAAATAPAPAKGTPGPPAPVASLQGRDTVREVAGPKAGTPVRWNEAGALFREQHPGCFRLVVVGNQCDLPAVVAALETLAPAAILGN